MFVTCLEGTARDRTRELANTYELVPCGSSPQAGSMKGLPGASLNLGRVDNECRL